MKEKLVKIIENPRLMFNLILAFFIETSIVIFLLLGLKDLRKQ